jgi:hypothetical protein
MPANGSVIWATPLIPVYMPVPLKSVTGPEAENENEQVTLLSVVGGAELTFVLRATMLTSKPPCFRTILT